MQIQKKISFGTNIYAAIFLVFFKKHLNTFEINLKKQFLLGLGFYSNYIFLTKYFSVIFKPARFFFNNDLFYSYLQYPFALSDGWYCSFRDFLVTRNQQDLLIIHKPNLILIPQRLDWLCLSYTTNITAFNLSSSRVLYKKIYLILLYVSIICNCEKKTAK